MDDHQHILITGGAGYIGSMLTGELLRAGYRVTVVDDLLFGGESLLAYLPHPAFDFKKADVCAPGAVGNAIRKDWPNPSAVIHLAAIVGFPACQKAGRETAWQSNVEAVERVFDQSEKLGATRFIFSSSYSNYGMSPDGQPVTEESPLTPQSLYAETKIAAEQWLLSQKSCGCAPLIFRFATLYGISPRTRFDLIVNQFTLEAITLRELIIYQRNYSRSFVHVRDVCRGIMMGLEAPECKTRGQIYNLGSEQGNHTKDEVVARVLKWLPDTVIRYKDLAFSGDMRDIAVSFRKIRQELGFETTLTIDDGICELVRALRYGMIRNPNDMRYRNAEFIIQ